MKRTALAAPAAVLAVLLLGAAAEEPQFPYTGKITARRGAKEVNVRPGHGFRFDPPLATLKDGDLVLVLSAYRGREAGDEWLEVNLPPGVALFVSAKYLKEGEGGRSRVSGDRVNLRSAPRLESYVLGQLSAGEEVSVLGREGEWARIAPPDRFHGWIHSSLVAREGPASLYGEKGPAPDADEAVRRKFAAAVAPLRAAPESADVTGKRLVLEELQGQARDPELRREIEQWVVWVKAVEAQRSRVQGEERLKAEQEKKSAVAEEKKKAEQERIQLQAAEEKRRLEEEARAAAEQERIRQQAEEDRQRELGEMRERYEPRVNICGWLERVTEQAAGGPEGPRYVLRNGGFVQYFVVGPSGLLKPGAGRLVLLEGRVVPSPLLRRAPLLQAEKISTLN